MKSESSGRDYTIIPEASRPSISVAEQPKPMRATPRVGMSPAIDWEGGLNFYEYRGQKFATAAGRYGESSTESKIPMTAAILNTHIDIVKKKQFSGGDDTDEWLLRTDPLLYHAMEPEQRELLLCDWDSKIDEWVRVEADRNSKPKEDRLPRQHRGIRAKLVLDTITRALQPFGKYTRKSVARMIRGLSR